MRAKMNSLGIQASGLAINSLLKRTLTMIDYYLHAYKSDLNNIHYIKYILKAINEVFEERRPLFEVVGEV
jgi:hypothetical protein